MQNDFLVGDLFVASVVIKALISTLKRVFPSHSKFYISMAMTFGVLSAFVLDISLFANPSSGMIATIIQKLLAGLYVGAASIGTHEVSKQMRKN